MTLTKSRFVMAVECPRKLVYSTDARYHNTRADDDFLAALAQSGHLIGTLAKLMHPGGIEITASSVEDQIIQTNALLDRENVTLFEPTFYHDNLVVRVDVLVKEGTDIRLIEVKSKSAGNTLGAFSASGHSIRSKWRPYVYDVAFQRYVLRCLHPEWSIIPYLMVPDTLATASVDGVSAKFKIERSGTNITVHVDPAFDPGVLEQPLLRKHDVTAEADATSQTPVASPVADIEFVPFIDWISSEIGAGNDLAPYPGNQCKHCEFYCPPDRISDQSRSGWNECMQTVFGLDGTMARSETVFGLWSFRNADTLLSPSTLALRDLEEGALAINHEPNKITVSERNWLQVEEAKGTGENRYLENDSLREAFANWIYPLHFIDFETSRPALPFHAGRRPYDQLLFQFSHHILEADGRLRHATQSLVTTPGVAPSVHVLRDLQTALADDRGTVIHWWDHERNVLKEIRQQLEDSHEPDRDALLTFIDTLIGNQSTLGRLADLGKLVRDTVFLHGTNGSSSIKKVLPAVLKQSGFLQERYAQPLYATPEMPSLNFPAEWTWLVQRDGQIRDPYTLLSPLFIDADTADVVNEAENDESENLVFVANGGAAMVAYGQLQDPDLSDSERQRIESQLKRYCELDTLAMVMVFQALNDWV